MNWEIEIEELLEVVEMAEVCAMTELAEFGCIGFEQGFGHIEPDENAAAWSMFFECDEYVPFELY